MVALGCVLVTGCGSGATPGITAMSTARVTRSLAAAPASAAMSGGAATAEAHYAGPARFGAGVSVAA